MFYAQNILFVFAGFYNMGQNGFLFFAEFLGVTPPPAAAAYPPPPASTAGERPGLPPAMYAVRVYHNGHIIQIPTQIIVYIM